jgi:DNA polymerase V
MNTIFALIDCNNFFVSCERLFRPDLEGRPVVVLSSNDGCAVSRSAEAKALGIPMGAPAFKYRQLFEREGVVAFSANFELYGDISRRITHLLTGITPRTEVYSVDESFLDLSTLAITNYDRWGKEVRARLLQEVGIPVSIGIARTKTLAKLANTRAKRDEALGGVLDLMDVPGGTLRDYLAETPIKSIWGVGWRLAPKLQAEGIYNAYDLSGARPRLASRLMGVHGRQLVAELNGQSCHPLEPYGRVRQTVMKGRMFGEDTGRWDVVESAVSSMTARAALVLRRDGLSALGAHLSLSTDRHKPGYRRQQYGVRFNAPTADTGLISSELIKAARAGFNPNARYHRANVLLYDLVPEHTFQADLWGETSPRATQKAQDRSRALDSINDRYGKRTLRYAAEDLSAAWHPRQRLRSPRYTTEWGELPVVTA